MIVSLRLQNFRSYADSSFEFEPGVNIIVGPNASGKTTIIEAITTMLGGKSFKARDYELVRSDAPWARLDVQTENHVRTLKLTDPETTLAKEYTIDGNAYKRLPSARTLPFVLFEPNDLALLHGSPEQRRAFIDDILLQIHPTYSTVLRHYKRVLAQRNALLKQRTTPTNEQLFVWNLRLSELGGVIAATRIELLRRFMTTISELYSSIASVKTDITLTYQSKIQTETYETSLLRALESSIDLDTARGFTGSGPHRDDVVFTINSRPANETASRGEIRTLVLTLKMLEAQFIEETRTERPTLLLDDVFSELDGARRQALVSFLSGYQAFITTTDADVVLEHFLGRANVIAL